MACESAKKHVIAALRKMADIDDIVIWHMVGWWTPATIDEALEELVESGRVIRIFHKHGNIIYRINWADWRNRPAPL